mmetsp:Transcript_5476/g.19397  ORF Transcript_5476/g.19397 Transcript_5476/m.19397 type:complete len:215 (+) Transcript_5476:241-885(+)
MVLHVRRAAPGGGVSGQVRSEADSSALVPYLGVGGTPLRAEELRRRLRFVRRGRAGGSRWKHAHLKPLSRPSEADPRHVWRISSHEHVRLHRPRGRGAGFGLAFGRVFGHGWNAADPGRRVVALHPTLAEIRRRRPRRIVDERQMETRRLFISLKPVAPREDQGARLGHETDCPVAAGRCARRERGRRRRSGAVRRRGRRALRFARGRTCCARG